MNQSDQLCFCLSGKQLKDCCAIENIDAKANPPDQQTLLENARNLAYQKGDFLAAEHIYRQLLTSNPNHIEALASVGQSLCQRYRLVEGRNYLVKASKQMLRHANKTEVTALIQLTRQLQMWGEIEAALQLARAAAKKAPENPGILFCMASCLHRLNHAEPAKQVLDKLLKLAPHDAGSHIIMALLEMEQQKFEQAGQRLQTLLKREHAPGQLARIYLELAKVYDKQKRYAEAFGLLIKTGEINQQLPEVKQIDANQLFNKISQYQQNIDENLLKRWTVSDFADDLPIPVFLIGFLRSGTTLMEQVLSAHPEIITSDENVLLEEVRHELENLSGYPDNTPKALQNLTLEQARVLRKFYWQRASEEFTPAIYQKTFINKTALNTIEIGLISVLFPEAKIIFALRDPRDVCLSCAMQPFTASEATVNLLAWNGIAKQYAAVMQLWLSLRGQIAPAYLELRYEDVVTDFENSFRQLIAFLGLQWRDEIFNYRKKLAGKFLLTPSFSAVTQPVYQTARARWQPYADYLKPVLPALQPYIKAFGYGGNGDEC